MGTRTSPHPSRAFQLWRFSGDGAMIGIAASGEVDISNARAFRFQLGALADGSATNVTLDLSDCSFLDPTGMYALILATEDQLNFGRRLELAGLSVRARRVLELAGFYDSKGFSTRPTPALSD